MIAAYLAEVERQDATEPTIAKLSAEELRTKIEQLKDRQQHYHNLTAELHKTGEQEISLTDADGRLMVVGQQRLDVCSNVQTVVDSKHKLIVEHVVTSAADDHEHLVPLAQAAKQTLGVETVEVVAERGLLRWRGG